MSKFIHRKKSSLVVIFPLLYVSYISCMLCFCTCQLSFDLLLLLKIHFYTSWFESHQLLGSYIANGNTWLWWFWYHLFPWYMFVKMVPSWRKFLYESLANPNSCWNCVIGKLSFVIFRDAVQRLLKYGVRRHDHGWKRK